MKVFSGHSADESWRAAALELCRGPQIYTIDSRAGPTVEMLHAAITVTDIRSRWVTSRVPTMNVAFSIAEVVQIVAGEDDTRFLAHWFPGFPRFVGDARHAPGAYGNRLRRRFGFDQLTRAVNALRSDEESRQVVLSIWRPEDDLPIDCGTPRTGDVPCNVLSCLRVVDGRLHWLQTCRSNDIFRGVPQNLVQFTYLQEILAGMLGIEVGEYCHVASSLHAYRDALKEFTVRRILQPVERSNDIRLGQADVHAAWGRLAQLAWELVDLSIESGPRVQSAAAVNELGPIADLYWILAAEDARRRGWLDECALCQERCSDPALRAMWRLWLDRVARVASSL